MSKEQRPSGRDKLPTSSRVVSRDTFSRLAAEFLGSRVVLIVTSIASVAMVTRSVGVQTYGVYATAVSFGALLFTFTDLGASQSLVRDAAKRTASSAISAYIRVRVILMLGTLVVGFGLIPAAFDSSAYTPAALALLVVPLAGPSLIYPIGQVIGSMQGYRTSVLLQGTLSLAATAIALFVLRLKTPVALVLAVDFGSGVATIYALGWVRKNIELRSSAGRWREVGAPLRAMATLGFATVLVSIYYRIDSVMVLRIAGHQEAGYYAAGYRLFEQARLVPTALLVPIAPLLAHQIARQGRVSKKTDSTLLRTALLGGFGLAALSIAVAKPAVRALMGPEFGRSAFLFTLLSISLSFALFSYVAGSKALNAHLERQYLAVAATGVLLNVVLNAILIPTFGAEGSAIATVVTEAVTTLATLTVTRQLSIPGYRRAVLASAVLALLVATIQLDVVEPDSSIQTAIAIALGLGGTGCLITALLAFRSLDRSGAEPR